MRRPQENRKTTSDPSQASCLKQHQTEMNGENWRKLTFSSGQTQAEKEDEDTNRWI